MTRQCDRIPTTNNSLGRFFACSYDKHIDVKCANLRSVTPFFAESLDKSFDVESHVPYNNFEIDQTYSLFHCQCQDTLLEPQILSPYPACTE